MPRCFVLCLCLLRALGTLPPNTGEILQQIQDEVARTPSVPVFADFFPALPPLRRRLKIASPCCGIHGTSHAMQIMKIGADSVLTYDLEDNYRYYLERHLVHVGMRQRDLELHLSKLAGDLMQLPLAALKKYPKKSFRTS